MNNTTEGELKGKMSKEYISKTSNFEEVVIYANSIKPEFLQKASSRIANKENLIFTRKQALDWAYDIHYDSRVIHTIGNNNDLLLKWAKYEMNHRSEIMESLKQRIALIEKPSRN